MKLDRNYFKRKANPKAKKGPRLTKCCKQDKDSVKLNKNNKDDWKLIEEHCEVHLQEHSEVENVEPICCDECGRLIRYLCELSTDKRYFK